jgi:hypothetical protein
MRSKPFSAAVVTVFLFASSSYAGPLFYVDAGAGYTKMESPSPFFSGTSSGTPSGYNVGLGLWSTLTTGSPIVNLQFGVLDRYENTQITGTGMTEGLNLPYGAARVQISRLFFTFGYCPYVWSSSGGTSTTGSVLSHAVGASSMLGEAGLLLPVTPLFSFGLSGSYESVSQNGIKSPSPIISGNVFMRFYFGFFGGSATRSSNEFVGWRYPFGKY